MKTIKFLFQILSAIVFVFLINPAEIDAQDLTVSKDIKQAPTYCDDLFSNTKTMLQKKANTRCSTMKSTLQCTDRKTGSVIYQTFIVQPKSDGCQTTIKVTDETENKLVSRGGTADFSVAVLQEQCARGGVTLTAYVPGNDNATGQSPYKFSWIADGKEIDKDMRVECVSKEKVTLKVTKVATYEVVTKNISIEEARSRGGGTAMGTNKTVTYCDELISTTKNALQKKANSGCKSTRTTIPCQDRKSGADVQVVIMAHPAKGNCRTTVKVTDITASQLKTRGGKADFEVEVMQEECPKGGVTLTAYVPGDGSPDKKKSYDFKWMVGSEASDSDEQSDGEVFDSDQQAECVSSEETTLIVTDIETGQTVVKNITLDQAVSRGAVDYKMIGFEKTACFGSCPVFKVSINKSGKAFWHGIANVDKIGTWEAIASKQTLEEIKDKAFSVNYFDYYSKYPVDATVVDASSTITFLRIGDMVKSINNTMDAPEELSQYEEFLAEIISTLDWKQVRNTDSSDRLHSSGDRN